MKTQYLYKWIFVTIILSSATLSMDLYRTIIQPVFQTEKIVKRNSFKQFIRYQKASQLISNNPFLKFVFHNYWIQSNQSDHLQFKQTIQQDFTFPVTFLLLKIITSKNLDKPIVLKMS